MAGIGQVGPDSIEPGAAVAADTCPSLINSIGETQLDPQDLGGGASDAVENHQGSARKGQSVRIDIETRPVMGFSGG